MKRAAVGFLVVLAVLGCRSTWYAMDPYSAPYMRVMDAARSVLARHYAIADVDRAHGLVTATSIVRANLATKFRTKAVARVYVTGDGTYDVEMRVTNELELSEPSLMGGGQPPYDWRAVGFDHLAETALMAEVQAQLVGQTVSVTPRSTYLMFPAPIAGPLRHSDLLRPPIPDPVGGAAKPGAAAPAPKPQAPAAQAAPKPAPEAPKASAADLFVQYLAMGDLHWQRGELDKALLEYQRAAVAAPKDPVAHLSLAGVWTALRRYNAAAAALRDAAGLANGDRLPNRELARLRGPEDALGERVLLLKGWCKQRPEDVDGRLLLAYHCFLAGRFDEAKTTVEGVLRTTPQDAAARFLARQCDAART